MNMTSADVSSEYIYLMLANIFLSSGGGRSFSRRSVSSYPTRLTSLIASGSAPAPSPFEVNVLILSTSADTSSPFFAISLKICGPPPRLRRVCLRRVCLRRVCLRLRPPRVPSTMLSISARGLSPTFACAFIIVYAAPRAFSSAVVFLPAACASTYFPMIYRNASLHSAYVVGDASAARCNI